MLNSKSVAMQIVSKFDSEWVEYFFGSREELVKEIQDILNQFNSVEEIKNCDESDCIVVQYHNAGSYSFKWDILKAYGLK